MTQLQARPYHLNKSLSGPMLFLFTFATYLVSTLYAAWQIEPPYLFEFLSPLTFAWMVWWWLRGDSRERGLTWPLDLGFFLYIGWMFVVPYYLIKTRGMKGGLIILAFVGTLIAAWIMGAIVAVLAWYS